MNRDAGSVPSSASVAARVNAMALPASKLLFRSPLLTVTVPVGARLAVTVRTAALLVVLPPELVTTTRNWAPLSAVWAAVIVKVDLVAPATLANAPLVPLFRCH